MRQNQRYGSKEILDALRECKEEYVGSVSDRTDGSTNIVLSADAYDSTRDDTQPSSATIIRRYGSWTDAKEAAGITSNREQKYSDEEILQYLKDCENEFGEVTPRNFKKGDYCSVSVVMRRFGGWSAAKHSAGIEDDLSSNTGRDRKWSNTQILSHLREVQNRLEKDPDEDGSLTTEALQRLGETPEGQKRRFVSPSVVIERFSDVGDSSVGGWITAKRKAGLSKEASDGRSNNQRPKKWDREYYIEKLQKADKILDGVTQRSFDQFSRGEIEGEDGDDWPSSAAYRKKFNRWSAAKEAAGLGDNTSKKYSEEELIELLRECERRYDSCTASRFAEDDSFPSPGMIQDHFGSWSNGKKKADVE